MSTTNIQFNPRNMHTDFALLCFVVVIHWLIFPYPLCLLHWHCGNLTIAPVPAKQPWWIGINTSCEFIMNDCITTIKQSTTKPCAYFLGYTVWQSKSLTLQILHVQSGRSPKLVALFPANYSSYIIKLLQLHDAVQIKLNCAWIHYNIAIRSHLMI